MGPILLLDVLIDLSCDVYFIKKVDSNVSFLCRSSEFEGVQNQVSMKKHPQFQKVNHNKFLCSQFE